MTQMFKPTALAKVSEDGTQWVLRRNCSATPGQLGGTFLALAVLSLLVAMFFWFMGATLVLPFAAIELIALATAFLVHARHATDRECIRLTADGLVVVQESAGRTRRSEFARYAVHVEPRCDGDRLVELRGGGQVVRIGRFLRSDLRPALAADIRRALRGG
jgi:uncharacterized membrane protein